jgi:hypothetical protein
VAKKTQNRPGLELPGTPAVEPEIVDKVLNPQVEESPAAETHGSGIGAPIENNAILRSLLDKFLIPDEREGLHTTQARLIHGVSHKALASLIESSRIHIFRTEADSAYFPSIDSLNNLPTSDRVEVSKYLAGQERITNDQAVQGVSVVRDCGQTDEEHRKYISEIMGTSKDASNYKIDSTPEELEFVRQMGAAIQSTYREWRGQGKLVEQPIDLTKKKASEKPPKEVKEVKEVKEEKKTMEKKREEPPTKKRVYRTKSKRRVAR